MNRVSGIFEREVSIRLELIANNHLVVYTNAATDPYTEGNLGIMIGQNQANMDAVIGSANYDIGHVFGGTSFAGLAVLNSVCVNASKARGASVRFQPVGDLFVLLVAHEMGHQLGAFHSFNGNEGGCAGNRMAGAAVEPGSGSTILSYAGTCGSQDLQPQWDDYLSWISILQIIDYTFFQSGSNCPVITPTGAVPPIVDAGLGGFTIPLSTPFTLTATATTVGAPTYSWEEKDLGPAGHPDTPSGNAPIFRSFSAVTSPSRTFPKLSDLLNNVHTIGELLPTYARSLSFRVTVRDVQAGGVGVDYADLAFSVSEAAGPFLVTAPNTAVVWPVGSVQSVTWDVSNTNVAPVNCANVNVLLSTDGGVTFPITLASTTPNDGSENVTVPNNPTPSARVKVAAADNVFFDISNVNFQVQTASSVDDGRDIAVAPNGRIMLHENRPNPFNPTTAISFGLPSASERVTLRVYDLAGRLVKTLVDEALGAGLHTTQWDGRDPAGAASASGVYLYELRSGTESMSRRMILLK
jgi:hypothetical protein